MKTVKIVHKCHLCGFEVLVDTDVNEYGFFAVPYSYCPNDFMMMAQDIKGHIKSITDEDENAT